MRLHRFISKFEARDNVVNITDQNLLNQWNNVLRLKKGGQVILCDGEGFVVLAEIKNLNKKEAVLNVLQKLEEKKESQYKTTLYLSILKRDNFELASQKATEVGISVIVPIVCERTVKLKTNMDRIGRIVREAAEQSGRTILPQVKAEISFDEAVSNAIEDQSETFLFDSSGEKIDSNKFSGSVNIFIGPEGGFTRSEVEKAISSNIKILSLGNFTLRAETAATVVSYFAAQTN